MARATKKAVSKRAPKAKAASGKTRRTAVTSKVPERQVTVKARRGTVSVGVDTKPALAVVAAPPRPPALPVKLSGSPLEQSRAFFLAHRLPMLAQALPSFVDSAAFEQQAQAAGLTRVLVFPPLEAQRAALDSLVQQLLAVPSPALSSSQQYSWPWLFDVRELLASTTHARPTGAYVQAIAGAPYPDDTRNRKASQLDGRLAALGFTSLTFFEYAVWQRLFAEEHQDHRFDQANADHGLPPGWQWLLDSRTARGAMHASWNDAKRRIEIGLAPASHFDARRGAHLTLVHPL